jgi:hypothetical protein
MADAENLPPPNVSVTEMARKTNNRFLAPPSWTKPRSFVAATQSGDAGKSRMKANTQTSRLREVRMR